MSTAPVVVADDSAVERTLDWIDDDTEALFG